MSTLGRKAWCRNPQMNAEWAISRPWTRTATFAQSYWQAVSIRSRPTLGKCCWITSFPAGRAMLRWLGDAGTQDPSLSLTWSTDWMKVMKTSHGEEGAPPLVVADSCWTSKMGWMVCFLNILPSFFIFLAHVRKKIKAWLSYFNDHYTSLLFHSKRHGKAGWTSFLESNVRNVVKWKVS